MYFASREKAVKAHPTQINPDKLKKATNKNHIPGQLYLDKGLPCELFSIPEDQPDPKAKMTPKGKKKQKSYILKLFLDRLAAETDT